jgi:hypothetical protein
LLASDNDIDMNQAGAVDQTRDHGLSSWTEHSLTKEQTFLFHL